MFYLVNTAHHHLDLPSALWTCVGSFSPLFISSTTTLVCWFTLRAKKPQQTDYRLAGEHSVTPFVVPYAKQISTSLKKKKKKNLTTDSLLQIEINPWSPNQTQTPHIVDFLALFLLLLSP